MNYNKQVIESITKLFAMLRVTDVGIKYEHQVLMVNKTTSFKMGEGKKGNFKNGKKAAAPVKKPKSKPKPKT
jgi:hypothetical protein